MAELAVDRRFGPGSSDRKRDWEREGLKQLRIEEGHDLLDLVAAQSKHADAVGRERAGLLV